MERKSLDDFGRLHFTFLVFAKCFASGFDAEAAHFDEIVNHLDRFNVVFGVLSHTASAFFWEKSVEILVPKSGGACR